MSAHAITKRGPVLPYTFKLSAPDTTTSGRDCEKSLWPCLHWTFPQTHLFPVHSPSLGIAILVGAFSFAWYAYAAPIAVAIHANPSIAMAILWQSVTSYGNPGWCRFLHVVHIC